MAVDMFMKIKGIEGESADKKLTNQIDVLSWSWGMSQSGSFHTGSGGGAGKASFQDISFTKWVDKATTPLMKALATGDHIEEAVLTCRKAGAGQQNYILITMKKCLVTSLSTGGSGGEDRLTENVTLNFAEVTFEYFIQDAKGGTKSAGAFKYDIAGSAAG